MLEKLIRNRTTEKDVRTWMDKNGFCGNSATITDLELHALQRPGWLQVFSFQVRVKSRDPADQPWQEMFGVVRDDERRSGDRKTEVELFTSAQQQSERLQQWSQGLITKSNTRPQSNGNLLLLIAAGLVIATIVLSLINLFT